MAVSNTQTLVQYVGNASTVTAYTIPFPFLDETWIKVQLMDEDGVVSQLSLGADYAVTGAGNPSGGSLTTSVAYAATYQLTIYRVVPLTQLVDLVYNDRLPAASIEQALDKLTFIVQQLAIAAGSNQKSLTFPISEPSANDTELPVPADRLAKLIYFNATTGELELLTTDELALTLDPTVQSIVDAKADVPEIKAASFAAENEGSYIVTANATVTDPTPVEGKGYTVFVRNGTATVNSVAYAVAGTIIIRRYQSAAWTSYVYYTAAELATLTQTLTNKTLTSPTLNTPAINNYTEGVVAIGNSGTSQTISLTNGTVQTCTLTGNCTFTMPTATAGKSFILYLKTGAGSYTGTFTGVKWPAGTTPTITTTASRMDIISFVADGANWYGSIVQNFTP